MAKARHPRHPILIVDDEPHVLLSMAAALRSDGLDNVLTCDSGAHVLAMLSEHDPDVVLLDLNMPGVSGRQLLPRIRESLPDLPVVIVTGVTEVALAVECMKQGVFDYLVKAVEKSKLVATVTRAVEIRELRRENTSLKSHLIERSLKNPEAFREIARQDERLQAVLMYAESIAETQHTVLISGETGVGKELFARAIHVASGRTGSIVAVNVAGFDENMFSDSLFGHVRGAYTSADSARAGLVEKADNGTLFLDEIGDLKPESQVKLLRLLESREYYQLGADAPRRSNARVIVATNRDIALEVAQGRFRNDLYYRLRTHHVHIPPLRERRGDIPLLAERFAAEAASELGRQPLRLPPETHAALRAHPFPGNIRELKSVIFDAVSRSSGDTLQPRALKDAMGAGVDPTPVADTAGAGTTAFDQMEPLPTIKDATEMLIAEALRRSSGNQSTAARLLGITPQALSQRLRRGER
jgi:two-component system, NtrC family, nitrogen regulation response regulator GlnG